MADTAAEIPKDVADALKSAGVVAFFAGLPPSHRREYLKWITSAKKPETRKTRVEKAVKMLAQKQAAKSK